MDIFVCTMEYGHKAKEAEEIVRQTAWILVQRSGPYYLKLIKNDCFVLI
jgi:hypothetical protein